MERVPGIRGACAVLAVGAVALASTACGNGTDGSGGSKGLGTITVITAISQSTPYIGVESYPQRNPWKGTGLTVKMVAGKTATVTPALASGSADIGVTAGNEASLATVKGVPTVIPACIMAPWRQNIIVKPGIKSVADLKGKTLGISASGSAGSFATSMLAKKEGWAKSDYKTVALGDVQGLRAGLQNGTIDAFVWNPSTAFDLQASGAARNLGSVQSIVGDNCFESFQVPKKLIKERPEAVKAFLTGYFKNVAYLKSHKSVARDIVVNNWHYSAKTVDRYLPDDLDALSSDGKISDAQLKGLVTATRFIVPSASEAQVKSSYSYWKDIK